MSTVRVAPLRVKAAGPADGLQEGQFEGYASVFDNVDSYGDIVRRGAFADSLEWWASSGDPIPLLWGHDLRDPFANVGAIDSAVEDERGLLVRGTFDLDNPTAVQVYKLAKSRRVTGMSFAFDVEDSKEIDGGPGLELLKLKLYECSIVPIGANPEAGVLVAKEAAREIAAKAGRVISAKNEAELRAAVGHLDDAASTIKNVLAAIDGEASKCQDETTVDAHDREPEQASGASPSTLVTRRLAAMSL